MELLFFSFFLSESEPAYNASGPAMSYSAVPPPGGTDFRAVLALAKQVCGVRLSSFGSSMDEHAIGEWGHEMEPGSMEPVQAARGWCRERREAAEG